MTLTATFDAAPLDVRSWQMELNDSWSPYIQGSVTIRTGSTILDPLDGAPRVMCTLGGTRVMDLALQRARVLHDGTTVLDLVSDEIRLQEYRRVAYNAYVPTTTSLRTLVTQTLDEVLPGATLSDGPDAVIDPAASVWEPGKSAQEFLSPHVQRSGFRLWCDELRVWHLDEFPLLLDGEVRVEYEGDELVTWETDINRDEYHDAVVLTFNWTDVLGDRYTAYDIASEPGFTSVYAETRDDTPFPGTGAAASILRRMRARGRSLPTGAIADYTATPGMSAIVDNPITGESVGWISAVQWNDDETMTIKTRDARSAPEFAWLLDPAGVSWLDVAPGIDWSEDV